MGIKDICLFSDMCYNCYNSEVVVKLQIREVGNSLGVILPKNELEKFGKRKGEMIDIQILDDPNWAEIEKFSKAEREKCNIEDFPADDFQEWESL